MISPSTTSGSPTSRLASLDAYRGFIMLLMASEGLGVPQMARSMPGSFWETLSPWLSHTEWEGGLLWDMIQPAFTFMVGVAVPYSCSKRLAQGRSWASVLVHAAIRCLVLIGIAILIYSRPKSFTQTNFAFTNVLGQIGLGYFFLVLLWRTSRKTQAAVFAVILVAYWAFFALWPLPPAGFDLSIYHMSQANVLPGFFGHWSNHINAAEAFDRWFLNLFPRTERFVMNPGGTETLNFIPSLATMLLGLMTGEWLRGGASRWKKWLGLVLAGIVCLGLGWLAGRYACPIVKRIWTPSWVLWSGGWVLLMLAFFFLIMDGVGWKAWALPLTVVGMNSIVIYIMSQFSREWFKETLAKHGLAGAFHSTYGPVWESLSVLAVMWLLLFWLYRQRVYLKI